MKKWKYKKLGFKTSIVLAMILFLSVGYAAISSIDLTILGSIFSQGKEPELEVAFTEEINTYGNGTIIANKVSDRVAEFSITDLKAYGDTAKVVYNIKNNSNRYYANLRIRTTDNDNEEYFDIQSELEKQDALAPGETTILTITVKVIKVATGETGKTANVTVMVNGTASKNLEDDWENNYGYNIVFTTLYSDGTLVFSRTGDVIPGKEVVKQYGDISGRIFTSSESLPWNEDKTSIDTIMIDGKIKPENTAYWFSDLPNLEEIENISNLDTSDVVDMSHMMEGPNKLEELDLSTFEVDENTNVTGMFNNTSMLGTIYYTEEWEGVRTPEKHWVLNDFVITLSEDTYIYNGEEHKPSVTIHKRSGEEVPFTAYRLSYKNNINAGTATVEIVKNEQSSYPLPLLEKTYTIQKKPIEITTSLDHNTYTYDGEEHKPNVEVLYNGNELPTTQYEVEYSNYINAGTAIVTIRERENGNYTFTTRNINYTINKKTIVPNITLNTTEYTYDGEAKEPDATVRDGDTVLASNQYSISYQNNVNAGTASAMVSSSQNGNYTFTPVDLNFTILQQTIEVDIVLQSNEDIIYDTNPKTPAINVYIKNTSILVPSTEYQVSYTDNIGPGTAYIHVENKTGGNYIVTSTTKSFEIQRTTYTITYNLNGGQRSSSDNSTDSWTQEITQYIPYNIISDIPYKKGYNFGGWSESSSSQTVKFTAGQQNVQEYENKTVYAIWTIVVKNCSSGKYLPMNTTTCVECLAGSYCSGGEYSFNETQDQGITSCATGSYSESHSATCTACPGGTTTSGPGATSCNTNCMNENHVSTWKTPNWNNNSPTNICTINTCLAGYNLTNNSCLANGYTIGYTMKGGTAGANQPTTGTYDEDVIISNPSKIITVTGNANGTQATIGPAYSVSQTFSGWSSTTIGDNAKTGTAPNPTTAWSGNKTQNTYFKNLKESGTVTMIANWTPVSVQLPSLSKTGYSCNWYTEEGTSGGTLMGASDDLWTPSESTPAEVTAYARCSINNPATPTISGGETKIYGSRATTLTCSTNTSYAPGTNIYYSFGYATSDGGTPANDSWTEPSTTSTLSISATAYVGQRWYSCRIYASDGTNTSSTIKSSTSADTEMTINNAKITFEANNCGTLTGTNPAYVKKNTTGVFTGIRNSTAGTLPSVSKTGYTFNGWYDGTTKIINGDGNVVANIANWTDTNKKWLVIENKTLTANCSANQYTISFNANGGTGGQTNSVQATYGQVMPTIDTNPPTRVGYTFAGWYDTDASSGGTQYYTAAGVSARTWNKTTNTTLYARWTANTYVITYYQGNGTSTQGSSVFQTTTTCTYNANCTLATYASLGGTFPLNDKGWQFTGWSVSETSALISYTNGQSFTYNISDNLNLYAVGKRDVKFAIGIAPTSLYDTRTQYWIPYSTDVTYATAVPIPSSTEVGSIGYNWNFQCFRANNTASSTCGIAASHNGTDYKIPVGNVIEYRTIYKRTLTLTFNANGGTGTIENLTGTQYYNSGYPSSGSNSGANVSTVTFNLPSSSAYSYMGYTFSKWAAGSTSGTQYSEGTSYTEFKPAVNNSTTTQTMYAIWTANELVFDDQILDGGMYGLIYVSNPFIGASNGTGDYTYSFVSGAPGGATVSSATRKITFPNTTNARTYEVIVKVTDNNSKKSTTATMTITIAKVNATCPTLTSYSGIHDRSSHTITVSGGSGGTIQYRTSTSDDWVTTKPTRTNAGTTTVYVQVAGDINHNTVQCYTSGTTNATINLYNARLDFNVNGGTISGTTPLYIPQNATNVYTGRTNTTAGTIPLATKSGYTFDGWYTAQSGGTKVIDSSRVVQASVTNWTDANKKWLRTSTSNTENTNPLYAHYTINDPATPTISGGASKIYGASATTLTCTNSTTYASGTSVYYSFGYATSDGGTPADDTWTTPSTTKTISVSATAYIGQRWYSCRVYATDGTNTSGTVTSAASADTAMTISNAKLTFDATTNGGAISGSATLYARKGQTGVYTGVRNSTAGTIPLATKTGWTFAGWYDGDTLIIAADRTIQANVENWTDSNRKWLITANKTLTAKYTINNPEVPTITGGASKIYGASATTLTCATTSTYASGTSLYYSFGYATSDGGTPASSTWTTAATSNTLSISATAFVGIRYYSCRVYATDGTSTSGTVTSAASADTAMTISNAKLSFNATTNGGAIDGTATLYARKGQTGVFTGVRNSTAGTIPLATKAGWTFAGWYSGDTLIIAADRTIQASVSSWTDADRKWLITANKTLTAKYTINNPATPTITGGATKIYGASATTLTCATTTTYASGTSVYYSFGYATSDGGTPGSSTWTTASTTNTLSISATEYVGQRWYSCRVYATDGTSTSGTVTSAKTADTAMTINNATLTFDATTNGGEISGTTPLYVKKGTTGVYTGIRNTTAGTIPLATKAGWTFTGWYSGNTKIIAADRTIQASVSSWTDASKNWLITANKTLAAKYTINNPATPTISGAATRVYNYTNITLTCNATAYASDTSVYYSFGYATSDGGTPANDTWTTPSTTKTLTVSKTAYRGSRWYSCRVYATSGSTTTTTATSDVAADAAASFVNARVFFDATTNGGTISGSVRLYVPYGATNVYTGRTNTTAGTIPTATKEGWTFSGWFTAASGGTKVIAADGTVQASVEGWTDADKKWLRTSATNNDTVNVLYAQYTANQYTISYTMNGGPNPSTRPTKGTYDADVQISNPGSKTVTVTGNANGTNATVGAATTGTQTFTGWTSTTVGSNAKTGTAANPTTAWTGTSTKNTYFRNLRESGTVKMIANWSGTVTLPTLTKAGYTCKWYTTSGDTGGSLMGNPGATYTLPNNSATAVTAYARCTLNVPATPTISGAATRVYNAANTTLTCSTATTYASDVTLYYSFGYATSDGGTPDNSTWTELSTTKTLTVSKTAYRGSRWYSCRISAMNATVGTDLVASAVTADAAVSFVNARVFFDVATNGGTISGAVRLYVPYGATNVYTGRTNTTAGTIPTATKTGYTFTGWYTAASGGTKVIAADGTVQASVEGWTDASKRWLRTAANNNDTVNVLYAQFSVNQYTISYTMNNGPNPSTKPTKGTYDADVQISNPGSKSITITPNANSSGATVGIATTGTQTFSGWTSTTVGSNAKTGTAANPTTAWTGTSTKNTYFRNLRESGTVTMIANYSGTMRLPTATLFGNNCSFYTTSGNSGGTLMGASGANYTIPSNSATAVTAYARCQPVSVTCSSGNFLPKNSTACSGCLPGSYCPGGTYTFSTSANQGTTACVKGSYSAGSQSACTACTGKTTSNIGQTSCNANCTNATGVATWKTATWSSSNNTVTNLCTINTCSTGYSLSSNVCNPVTHVYADDAGIGKATLTPSGTYKATLEIQRVAGNNGEAVLKIPGTFNTGDTVEVTAVQTRSNTLYYLAFSMLNATAVSATGYPYSVEPYMNQDAGWFAIFYDYNGTSKTFKWTLKKAQTWLTIRFNRSNSDATFYGSMKISQVKVNGTVVLG